MKYKILVSTWGNPEGWKEAKYRLGDETDTAKSSMRLLKKVLKPDDNLLVVLDSLAINSCTTTGMSSYGDLVEATKQYVKDFAVEDLGMGGRDFSCIVTPAVGRYCRRDTGWCIQFYGSALDYYNYLTVKLVDVFLKNEALSADEIKIHLDLTHGVNFMPVMTYRALRDIVGILAFFKDVELVVYNADPYIGDGDVALNVNEVERRKGEPFLEKMLIDNNDRFLTAGKEYKEFGRRLAEEVKGRVDVVGKSVQKEVSAFLSAARLGFPICIYSFMPSVESLKKDLENILDLFRMFIDVEVHNSDRKIDVRRKAYLRNSVAVLAKAMLIAALFEKIGVTRKKEVTLSEMEELLKNFSKNLLFKHFVSYDLTELRKRFDEKKSLFEEEEWVPSERFKRDLKKEGEQKPDRKEEPNIDTRTFIAHSGLPYGLFEVSLKNGDYVIRYKESKIKSEVLGNLLNIQKMDGRSDLSS